MTSNQGDEDTLSQASFGSWERDFEDTGSQSDGSGWWSDGDGDDTSREGSDFSEDSATGQAFRPNHSGMGGRQGAAARRGPLYMLTSPGASYSPGPSWKIKSIRFNGIGNYNIHSSAAAGSLGRWPAKFCGFL